MARRNNNRKNKGGANNKNPDKSGASQSNKQGEEVRSESKSQGEGINDPAPNSNDPEWYGRDPQLLMDVGRIPFSLPFGDNLDLIDQNFDVQNEPGFGKHYKANPNSRIVGEPIPGVCVCEVAPTFGHSRTMEDALNVAANALYTHVRYVNSGRKNYDPADLMMYVSTFADMYALLNWAIRTYNLAFMYSQQNLYFARGILTTEGWDVDDLVVNLANMRTWINMTINKVASFAVPADIYYFKRRAFMFANIYIENPYGNLKDQIYLFSPSHYFKFALNETDTSGELQLKSISRSDGLWKWTMLVDIFNDVFENINGDEDFGLMSGDILKAFQGNIITLSSIGDEGGIIPVFDAYVLAQMKNATIVSSNLVGHEMYEEEGKSYKYGWVQQKPTGVLISEWKPAWQSIVSTSCNKVLSIETPESDVGMVIEATRLVVSTFHDADGNLISTSTGSDVVTSVRMARYRPQDAGYDVGVFDSQRVNERVVDDSTAADMMLRVQFFGAFKYAPLLYGFVETPDDDDSNLIYLSAPRIIGNVDNHTVITGDEVRKLHDVAMLSLLYVPGVAKMVNRI